ncbi:MAG: FkbM family methyltransferase [Algicola sp.]|nr:FkbM family methyltransferase [Algicola sp.]
MKKVLKKLLHRLNPTDGVYVNKVLCGVPLRLLEGTLREKEDQDDAWWFHLCKDHSVIYDIGCNTGYTALLALIQDPDKQMILVDPNPMALKNAAQNIIINLLGNRVNYVSAFVGNSTNSTVKFYTVGAGEAGSMYASHAVTAASRNSFLEVKTVTLDDLFAQYHVLPDLVKIDVEGAETMVMEGARLLAKKSQCAFFVEMHHEQDLSMEDATQLMINWCNEENYNVWYLKTGEKITASEVTKNRGKCHLLLLPKSRPYPEYLKGIDQNAALPKTI